MPLRSITRVFTLRTSLHELDDADWHALGFSDSARVRGMFARLRERADCGALVAAQEMAISRALAESSDPEQALFMFESWVEAGGAASGGGGFLSFGVVRAEVFENSLRAFLGDSGAFELLHPISGADSAGDSDGIDARSGWREGLGVAAFGADEAGVVAYGPIGNAATNARRMHVADRGAGSALISPLNSTVRALSELADVCIGAALEIADKNLRPRMGWLPAARGGGGPPERLPFVVFALGKLGGGELNYSSDIDLVFAHNATGETRGGARSVPADVYVAALAEELIAALDKVTDDGRVYRVDMRLRPHGSAGALVRGEAETLDYFQAEGRTWNGRRGSKRAR